MEVNPPLGQEREREVPGRSITDWSEALLFDSSVSKALDKPQA